MTQLINWCTQHWQDVLAIIGGVVSVATIIVKLTPTQKDDAVLGRLLPFCLPCRSSMRTALLQGPKNDVRLNRRTDGYGGGDTVRIIRRCGPGQRTLAHGTTVAKRK